MVSANLIEQSETKLWFINREKGLTLLSLPLPPPKPSQTSYTLESFHLPGIKIL